MNATGRWTALKQIEVLGASQWWLRARSLPQMAGRGHVVRRMIVRRYLVSAAEPRLQVGAGPTPIPGWLNSDLLSGQVYLDLARPLPLPADSFSFAFGEHVIEHLPQRAGLRLLGELRRVLRPGGVLRLTTPDLRKIVALYEDRNPVISQADYARFLDEITHSKHERGCQVFNTFMHDWGHRFVYDLDELTAKLHLAGFTHVEPCEPGESTHAPLRGLERHGPPWQNAAEAMCVEATR